MTEVPRRRSLVALAVALSVAFALLAHLAIAEGFSATLGAALSLIPLAILVAVAVRRSGKPAAAVAVILLAAAGLWLFWGSLERHFPDVFFVEHAGGNLALAIVFGRTLAPNHEPLCTRFARLIHGGTLAPDVVVYTRQVTVAWTVFFSTLFALSASLYLGGFLTAWSVFANMLTPILLGAMFVVEYAIRLRALPDHEQVGILGGIRAFSRHLDPARFEAPR